MSSCGEIFFTGIQQRCETWPTLLTLFFPSSIKRSRFTGGDLTPPVTKGDARPLWKPHNIVPASRGGVNIEIHSVPNWRGLPSKRENSLIPRIRLAKKGCRGAGYNCQIGSQKQKCDQKIPFPMIAQGDAEREAGEKTTELPRSTVQRLKVPGSEKINQESNEGNRSIRLNN